MLSCWDASFAHAEPMAHELRVAFPRRWVRFHSLPASKRYPENEAEYAMVLERFNSVVGSLVGPGSTLVLLLTQWQTTAHPSPPPAAAPDARHWRTVQRTVGEENAELIFWHIYAQARTWQAGAFDEVVRRVADDELSNVMLVAEDCRWLVHPYDGGLDVIARDEATRDELRANFSSWLSSRPDGL
jgi:hypothetical protein